MKLRTTLLIALSTLAALPAMADELDPVAEAPQGLVVRIHADGKRDVFKADLVDGIVQSDEAAARVADAAVKDGAELTLAPLSELDRVSSDDSWYFSWSFGYYSYSYYRYGSYYSYYPSYTYYRGGYQYNYYYTPTYYGYYGSYRCYDRYGSHWGGRRGWRR